MDSSMVCWDLETKPQPSVILSRSLFPPKRKIYSLTLSRSRAWRMLMWFSPRALIGPSAVSLCVRHVITPRGLSEGKFCLRQKGRNEWRGERHRCGKRWGKISDPVRSLRKSHLTITGFRFDSRMAARKTNRRDFWVRWVSEAPKLLWISFHMGMRAVPRVWNLYSNRCWFHRESGKRYFRLFYTNERFGDRERYRETEMRREPA